MAKPIVGFVAVACTLVGVLVWSQYRTGALKVSGFVEADEIRVGSRVGGRVARVAVVEGQRVAEGDLLIELEPFDLLQRRAEAAAVLASRKAEHEKLTVGFRQEEIAQAEAHRDQLAAKLEELQNGPRSQEIDAAQAELDLAEAELQLATEQFNRYEALFGDKAVSEELYDQARTNLRVARANVEVRREKLSILQAGTRREQIAQAEAGLREADQSWQLKVAGFRKEEIVAARAAVDAAEAALAAIDAQIDELKVFAPIDSVVEAVDLEPGDLIAANAPVISLMDTGHLWVRAYVPEDELDLTIGQELPISVDSYPGKRFVGRISFIARQAEFTPGNVQTPEERSKQVFRIKVNLTEGLDKLRPGMAADVWLKSESD
jgi:multidrug resistance efflux pump